MLSLGLPDQRDVRYSTFLILQSLVSAQTHTHDLSLQKGADEESRLVLGKLTIR